MLIHEYDIYLWPLASICFIADRKIDALAYLRALQWADAASCNVACILQATVSGFFCLMTCLYLISRHFQKGDGIQYL